MAIHGQFVEKDSLRKKSDISPEDMNRIVREKLWLKGLNKEQLLAVEAEGNLSIIASAGSGKTKTIIARLAHLIHKKKVAPDRIVATTFTQKAAGEMKSRLHEWGCRRPQYMGTFHSVMSLMMRNIPRLAIPYRKNFTVAKGSALKRIITRELFSALDAAERTTFENLCKDARGYMLIDSACDDFLNMISALKGNLAYSATFRGIDDFPDYFKDILRNEGKKPSMQAAWYLLSIGCYQRYERIKASMNVMDVDDLLYVPTAVMVHDRNTQQYVSSKIDHVIVDEDQDCSLVQVRLAELLSDRQNLVKVGDDAQSIYGWRGSDVSFTREWASAEDVTMIRLVRNYRSSEKIVNFANEITRQDITTIPKEMIASGQNKDYAILPIYTKYDTEDEEVNGIIEEIQSMISNGVFLKDIAILSRTRRFAEKIYMKLLASKILARYDRDSFFSKKIIKFYMAAIRLSLEPENYRSACIHIEDLFDVPEIPLGIGEKMVQVLVDNIKNPGEDIPDSEKLVAGLEMSAPQMRGEKAKIFIKNLADNIKNTSESIKSAKKEFYTEKDRESFVSRLLEILDDIDEYLNVQNVINNSYNESSQYYHLVNECYEEFKKNRSISLEMQEMLLAFNKKNASRWTEVTIRSEISNVVQQIRNIERLKEDIETMRELIVGAGSFEGFIEMSSLGIEAINTKDDAIEIMTIHGAKGLEWDHVFWAGFHDTAFFPDKIERASDPVFYESVRLCYVAATRAKKELHMSWSVMEKANTSGYSKMPCRIFLDIDPGTFTNDDPDDAIREMKETVGHSLENLRVKEF